MPSVSPGRTSCNRPDPATFRVLPWQPGAALVICDYVRPDGSYVVEAPRSVLKAQLARLAKRGWGCFCASELEFYLFNQTYESAFAAGYRLVAAPRPT